MFVLVWLTVSVVTALAITQDMRRMQVSRVDFGPVGWAVASLCGWPVAAIWYLARRRATYEALIDSAFSFIGDDLTPYAIRLERLVALEQLGILGKPIYRACKTRLDEEMRNHHRRKTNELETKPHPTRKDSETN